MKEVTAYIISLVNLYGMVHKNKVVEIFNKQNEEAINCETIEKLLSVPPKALRKAFIEVYGEYFVHESILQYANDYGKL